MESITSTLQHAEERLSEVKDKLEEFLNSNSNKEKNKQS
jgi:hypothetical protein